ncbi:YqeG family HAD IIIA-type phosphatase [Chamaesiphon sp.]|uniref:YqeG family HAD IIIA-type phosphatase n=1 Tax=Chamaesiphon sp. TaxID=2814140 RepID=UPI0035943478
MNKNPIVSCFPNFLKRNLRADRYCSRSDTLAAIDLDRLIDSGIKGIILDLDNTIVSEDDRYLSPDAISWIGLAKTSGFKLFILSNGKRHYRVRYWSEYLDIPALSPARKPFPGAFNRALRSMQLAPDRVIVIGDSLHTDLLGAWIVGCPHIQVASLPHPPRWWEKLIGKYVQNTYPSGQELWEFKSSNYFNNN